MIDIINLSIRIALLLIIGATTETAFKKRLWGIGAFGLFVWTTMFKLALLRAIAIYIGVFSYEKIEFVKGLQSTLTSSWFNNIGDFLFLISAFMLYLFVATYQYQKGVRSDGR